MEHIRNLIIPRLNPAFVTLINFVLTNFQGIVFTAGVIYFLMKLMSTDYVKLAFAAFVASCVLHINLGFKFYFHLFFVNVLLKLKSQTRRWTSLFCYLFYYREIFYSYLSTLVASAVSLVPENALLPVINFPIYALSFFPILLDSIKSVVNYICVTFITVILYSQQIF